VNLMKQTVNVLVPVGQLGGRVRAEEVAKGIAAGAHAIAVDAGSTDSGAAYLSMEVRESEAGKPRDDSPKYRFENRTTSFQHPRNRAMCTDDGGPKAPPKKEN
jgi:hypothetical protein